MQSNNLENKFKKFGSKLWGFIEKVTGPDLDSELNNDPENSDQDFN